MKLLNCGMIKKVLFIFFGFSLLCFSSYASNRSASSLGKGNWQAGVHLDDLLASTTTFESINFAVVPGVAVTGGLSEKLDLTLSSGTVELKYSFLNNRDGLSIAGVAGWPFAVSAQDAGDTIDLATGLAVGPMLSYKSGGFETYIFALYAYSYLKKGTQSQHSQSLGGALGFNFWLSESTALNLNAGVAFPLKDGQSGNSRLGVGLLWRI